MKKLYIFLKCIFLTEKLEHVFERFKFFVAVHLHTQTSEREHVCIPYTLWLSKNGTHVACSVPTYDLTPLIERDRKYTKVTKKVLFLRTIYTVVQNF